MVGLEKKKTSAANETQANRKDNRDKAEVLRNVSLAELTNKDKDIIATEKTRMNNKKGASKSPKSASKSVSHEEMENLSSRANKRLYLMAAQEDRKKRKMEHDADIQKKKLEHDADIEIKRLEAQRLERESNLQMQQVLIALLNNQQRPPAPWVLLDYLSSSIFALFTHNIY